MENSWDVDIEKYNLQEKAKKKFLYGLRRKRLKYQWIVEQKYRIFYDFNYINEYESKVIFFGYLSEVLDYYQPLKIECKEDCQNEICLPIEKKVESSTYLFYSTRLAILQATDGYEEWLKQYMIQIVMFYNPNYANYYFFDEQFENAMTINGIMYEELIDNNIIKFIQEKVQEKWYINIHLDDFYLSAKDGYQKRHFVHENLIYGFDNNRKVFLAFGFAKRQKIDCFNITYTEMLQAYEKGKLFYFCGAGYLEEKNYFPVSLCKAKKKEKENFTVDIFLEKIRNFVYPRKTEIIEGDIHVYGSNIYLHMCQELENEVDEKASIDLRVFQLLYEQKLILQDRIVYIMEKYRINELDNIRQNYFDIINAFQRMRILYMKELYKEGGCEIGNTQRIYSKEVRRYICQQLSETWNREKCILKDLEKILVKKCKV